MPESRFDGLERQAADNIDRLMAEVEKDRDELAIYSGRRLTAVSGHSLTAGAQQVALNGTKLLNTLRELSRTLKDR